MESRIRPLLHRYADFDFAINYEDSTISFTREVLIGETSETIDNIKISRGEENIFIWCFFLAIVQLVVDGEESYKWVKYIYVDDPISSLDDNNVIAVASHLAQLMKSNDAKIIVSTHHTLFFNVLCNEIENAEQLFLQRNAKKATYLLKDTTKTPFFHHVALLKELKKASDSGALYTYHFNILRNILEKTASFHGFSHFSYCIRKNETDSERIIHKRILDLLSHGNYSLFDPKEMIEENKELFKSILNNFLEDYKFNQKIFENTQLEEA
jgi:wobble nucleotide-excising tRNase